MADLHIIAMDDLQLIHEYGRISRQCENYVRVAGFVPKRFSRKLQDVENEIMRRLNCCSNVTEFEN